MKTTLSHFKFRFCLAQNYFKIFFFSDCVRLPTFHVSLLTSTVLCESSKKARKLKAAKRWSRSATATSAADKLPAGQFLSQ